jgi:hypothetical protein
LRARGERAKCSPKPELACVPQAQARSCSINDSQRAPPPCLPAHWAQASKEAALEKALARMKSDWQGLAFRVVAYKDTGTYVIGGADDVQALLDDHIVKVCWAH